MTRARTIGLAAAALAATLSLATVSAQQPDTIAPADAFPPYEIVTAVRAMGLDPIRQPVRRGPYYVLHAYDPRGVEMRIVADAQFGDIISVEPTRALETSYAPSYTRGPRIIQVPRPGEHYDDRASLDRRGEPDVDHDDEDAAPPPPRRIAPKPKQRSDIPPEPRRKPFSNSAAPAAPAPAPVQRRTVLSAPPLPAQGPSPVYPTPRFGVKPDQVEKSDPPHADATPAPEPLEGLAPPATLPRRN